MAEPVALKYRAFISYSHADAARAKWLHRALESFRIDKDLVGRESPLGPVPATLKPIFRDRDDFTAGHTLTDQTQAALDASAALIVICSPAAAKSLYVNEEIRLFKSRHPERPVIPLIVDGKPGDPELGCFPPTLSHKVDAGGKITGDQIEVLAADAREEGDSKSLALAKVVAGLLGVSSDDIFRRAMRERRRRQQRWIGGLSVVALMLAGLAVWAEINRREAVAQRQEAERNFTIAKQGADSLVFEIAQALKHQEGMRIETVRKILGTAEDVIGKLVAKSGDNLELLRLQGMMLTEFSDTYETQGDTTKQEEAGRKALAIAEQVAKIDPDNKQWQADIASSYERLGDALKAQGKLGEALSAYQSSLAIREHHAKRAPKDSRARLLWRRDLAITYDKVGDVLAAQGKLAEALHAYQDGLAIREDLTKVEPDNAEWQRDLSISYNKIGDVWVTQGDLASALKSYQDGLAIAERLAKENPGNANWQRDLSVSYNQVGNVLREQGNLVASVASYRDTLALRERLAKADPGNARWQSDLASALYNLGLGLSEQGNLAEALKFYREGLAIFERLVDADPGNAYRQWDLSLAYRKVGLLLAAQSNFADALKSYQDSLAIAERLAKASPDNAVGQRELTVSYQYVGTMLAEQGNLADALKSYESGLAITQRLAEADPSNAQWQRDLSVVHQLIGDALRAHGKLTEALDSYRKTVAIREALVKTNAENVLWRSDLEASVNKIGSTASFLVLAKNFAQALDAADQTIALAPDKVWLYTNRAHALMFLDRVDEARALYLQHRGAQKTEEAPSWEEMVLVDFAEMRKAGLTHPLMDEIEAQFGQAKSAEPNAPQPEQAAR